MSAMEIKRSISETQREVADSDRESRKRIKPSDPVIKRQRSADPSISSINTTTNTDISSHIASIRPPVIPLQPSQRLDLFKRRQRWRQTNFYNSLNRWQRPRISGDHKNNSILSDRDSIIGPAADSTNLSVVSSVTAGGYVEAATQTELIPKLKSRPAKVRKIIKDRESVNKSEPGIFSGSIVYDSDELRDEKDRAPLKFPNNKKLNKGSIPLSTDTLNTLLNEKTSFQVEQPAAKGTAKKMEDTTTSDDKANELSVDNETKSPVGPSAGFNFLKSKDKVQVEQFNSNNEKKESDAKKSEPLFGSDTLTNNQSTSAGSVNFLSKTKEGSTPTGSFPNFETKATKNPTFNFGSSETHKQAPLLSAKTGNKAEEAQDEKNESKTKPSFSFGEPQKPTFAMPTSLSHKTAASSEKLGLEKPVFSFGSSNEKPAFAFGKSSDVKLPSPPVFGSQAKGSTNASMPSFTFGNSSESGNEKKKKREEADFDSDNAKIDENKEKPKFDFRLNKTGTGEENEEKPVFSFGTQKLESNGKPAFSFGSTVEQKKDTPNFSFGKVAEKSKPSAFLFGQSSNPDVSSTHNPKPQKSTSTGLNFDNNANLDGEKKQEPKAFTFGSTAPSVDSKINPIAPTSSTTSLESQKPISFSFGSNAPKPSNDKEPATKPTFNFGSISKPSIDATTTSTPKATLFGSNPTLTTGSTFKFGNPTNTNSTTNEKTFQFGASAPATKGFPGATTSTPAFAFDGASTPNPPASVPFGQLPPAANNGSAFSFGATTNPLFPSQAASNTTAFNSQNPSTFSFNSNKNPNSQSNGQSAFGGTGTSFSFGGATAATDPSKIFGSSQTPFGQNGNASLYGSPAPGTPSQPQQPRVAGRKLAQMRQRRR